MIVLIKGQELIQPAKFAKKALRAFWMTTVLIFVLIVEAFFNLSRYAVYYAKHTPHAANIDPAAVELIENMYFNYNPRDDLYFKWKKEIVYSLDKDGNETFPTFEIIGAYDNYRYTFAYQNNSDFYYTLDVDLNTIDATSAYSASKEIKIDGLEKQRISREAKQFIEPIIEAQPKPYVINLQWLYDYINHDRFN